MNKINPNRLGLVLGGFLGLWHAAWAALVAANLAKPLLDFVLYLHFIKLPVDIESFELVRAGMLVGITAIIGYVGGLVIGAIWNLVHRG
jgi:hypothetical protein